MIKKILITTAVFLSLQAEIIDLGKIGETFPIIEEDHFEALKKQADKVDKKKLKKEYEEKVVALTSVNYNLPFCKKDKKVTIPLDFHLKEDFILPEYDIHIPKDSPLPLKKVKGLTSFVFNATDEVEKQFILEKNPSSVLISSGDLNNTFFEKIPNKYVLTNDFINTFKIQCTPTIIETSLESITLKEIFLERDKDSK